MKRRLNKRQAGKASGSPLVQLFEGLENRVLLSHGLIGHHRDVGGGRGDSGDTTTYATLSGTGTGSDAAAATELQSLATQDGLGTIAGTQTVFISTDNGTTDYSVTLTGSGQRTTLISDSSGNAVTPPTNSSTTYGTITDTAVTDEFTALASALNLTAPTTSTSVREFTNDGTTTYTLFLSSASTSGHARGESLTVDSNGNPVGNETVTFGTLQSTPAAALQTLAGSTTIASTQKVQVGSQDGTTVYTVTLNPSAGVYNTYTVTLAGTPINKPSRSTTTFSALQTSDSAAYAGLNTLATNDSLTISSTQTVSVYEEGNGTTLYTVHLTGSGQSTTLTVDENGNAATLPTGGGRGLGPVGGPGGGFGGPLGGLFGGGGNGGGGGSSPGVSAGVRRPR